MLLQRSFFAPMSIRSRCMSERNLVVPSNIIKTNSIKGRKAVNNGAFRSECVISETTKVSLILNKLSLNSSIILQQSSLQIKRFHTGRPNHNPLAKIPFLLFVRPLISIVGNILTRLWKRLDPDKKKQIKSSIKQFKLLFPFFAISLIVGVYLYYQQNVEEVDILGIKRKRFIILRTSQLDALASLAKQYILSESNTLPDDDVRYRRVSKILERIILANQDVKEVKNADWKLYIVDNDEVNTVGLPDNSLFIFKGMLDLCSNDDQLATVTSHLVARSVLSQYADDFSRFNLITIMLAIPFVFFSFFDFGFLTACIISVIFKTLTVKPYNREMVLEADVLGLKMAAKACFDIKEATLFWDKMILHLNRQTPNIKRKMVEGIHYEVSRIVDYDYIKVESEIFDSHPSHENRGLNITKNVAQIINSPLTSHCFSSGCNYLARFMELKNYETVIKQTI